MYTIKLLGRNISVDQSSTAMKNGRRFNVDRNPFICSHCSKAFRTTQALGGHQNAHRRERNEEQRRSTKERRKKAEEIPSQSPKPPGNCQIIDFWAKHLAKRAETSHGRPLPDEKNQKFMANWEMDGYVERDFMTTAEAQGGDSWLEEFQVAIPETFGGGDYGSHELTSTREFDLTLKL